ncbi:MAG: SMP-30/gluconolactonase/LRE family protein [Planctomycetes bacterium]|nr:SMP-30/gluconolactonase/LRE family protein [Planctomycetota bacterium]
MGEERYRHPFRPGFNIDARCAEAGLENSIAPPLPEDIGFYPIVAGIDFAEGPTFDPKGNLYFTRYLRNGTVGRRTPDGTVSVWAEPGGQPNGLKVDFEGNVLVADQMGKRILRIPPEGKPVRVLTESCDGKPYLGPNDICLDRARNIYFSDAQGSSIDRPIGAVYRIDPNGDVEKIASGFAYPNGLAVTVDRKRFYLSESGHNRLHVFDIDAAGKLANRRVLHQFPDSTVDGLALDEYGRIWVARWEHGTVDVVSPEGDLVGSIPAGGRRVTNLCFWGQTIFVSVAGQRSIHRLDVEVRGAEIVPGTVGPTE